MALVLETGWSLEYIYDFDFDDFTKVLRSLSRLKGQGESKPSRVVSPSEFIKKYN